MRVKRTINVESETLMGYSDCLPCVPVPGMCLEETGAFLKYDHHQKVEFGESGRPREPMIRFGLTAEFIAARARELQQRKGRKD
jgi:hypothetical protein